MANAVTNETRTQIRPSSNRSLSPEIALIFSVNAVSARLSLYKVVSQSWLDKRGIVSGMNADVRSILPTIEKSCL